MKNQRGFTLIEIMLSIMILTIALIPMAGMFSSAHYGITHGKKATEAMALAQDIMEGQKARHLKNLNIVAVSRTTAELSGFEYSVNVSEPVEKIKDVKVTVYYSLDGAEQTVSLITRMGDWR